MSTFVMSSIYPQFADEIKNMGHRVIETDAVKEFLVPEQTHVDMQMLKINDKIFILNECEQLKSKIKDFEPIVIGDKISKKYPNNILLNFLFINNKLFGKKSHIASKVYEYCNTHNIEIENVNQGYARCSTLVVSDNSVITADDSIYRAMLDNGINVLRIGSGHIRLDGFDYGFIGGAGGRLDENHLVFFGNIFSHPQYKEIKEFCNMNNVKIKCLCENMPLTDIGGIMEIK